MSSQHSARSIADLTGGTILATVDIAIAPERVFRALTDSDEIIRWWGSDQVYRTEAWMSEQRVGGAWRSTGRSADGGAFSVGGVFLEFDPPHRLVQTWKPDWDDGHETIVTWQLAAIADGTRLTVRHDGFAGRPAPCQSHANGWEAVLVWLGQYLSVSVMSAVEHSFLYRLIPPRPDFPTDMSSEERAMMQAHVAYWTEQVGRGSAMVFGPVADPNGSWGLAVIRAASDEHARALGTADPAIRSDMGFRYDVLPMPHAVTSGGPMWPAIAPGTRG